MLIDVRGLRGSKSTMLSYVRGSQEEKRSMENEIKTKKTIYKSNEEENKC